MTKNKKPKRVFRWLKLLGIVVVALVLLRLSQQYSRYMDISEEVAYYQTQLQIAETQLQEVQKQKDLYFNDSFLERMARENLGMIKEGEILLSPAEGGDLPDQPVDDGSLILH